MFVNGNLVGTTSAGIQVPIAVDSEGKILISGLGITIGNKVTDYASLPTPAIDYDTQLWYVDNSTGLSWGKRKGWYESTGGAWVRSSNQTFQVMDNEATISDNDDNTKKMDFQLDQITTGNTRTITMSDYDVDLGALITNTDNVIRVAKSGGDFTTIQGAHDSITDSSTTNRYVVQVAPGRYNERLTPTDYVSTVGMGDAEDVVIYSDNKIIDITTQNHTSWYNLYLLLDTAVGNREVVEIDAGEHEFFHCKLEWTSTADSIRGWVIDLNGGEVELENCYIRYNNLSAVGGGSQNTWFDIDGSGKLDMQGCNVSMIQNNDASIRAIDDNSTVAGSMHIANCSFYIGITTTSYTSSCFFYRQNNAGSERVVNNCQIHLNNSSGVTGGGGIGFWLDNTGVVLHSHGNDIVITGFTNPRTFQIDLGATAHSSFDNIRNFQQTSIDGTLNINSVDYEEDTFWCSTDVQTNIDKAFYIGDKDTNDSWRFILDGDDLSFQRRESGTWVEKGGVDA